VRLTKGLGDVVHRTCGDADLHQAGAQLSASKGFERLIYLFVQDVTVFDTTDIRLKAFVCGQIGSTNFLAELQELRVVVDASKHLSVTNIKSVVRWYIGMRVTP
jgi:hypothetical protein